MATSTTHYGLRKPDPADTVNVATDINASMDTIDTNMKRIDDASKTPELYTADASATLTLSTTETDIAGATITFTTDKPNVKVEIIADFDFECTVGGTGYCYGIVWVDGAFSTDAIFNAVARIPGSQTKQITIAAAGSHTIKLRGKKDVAAGTVQFNTPRTRLHLRVYDK